jgi:signal transduction histidine kinase
MSMEGVVSSRDFLQKGGQCGKHMRIMDWQKSPLGDPEKWPHELKTVSAICLHANVPMIIWWSEKFIMLYNDAAIPIIGSRHPDALGAQVDKILPELYPIVKTVLQTGEASSTNDQLLMLSTNEKKEEAYFSSYHCSIHDEKGEIEGVLTTFLERTHIVQERRLADTLLQLNKALIASHTQTEVYTNVSGTFGQHQHDFPYIFIYERNDRTAKLVASSGNDTVAPGLRNIDLSRDSYWPLKTAFRMDQCLVHENSMELKKMLRLGNRNETPEKTLLFPVNYSGQPTADVILIFGINPNRATDAVLMTFVKLFVDQVTDRLSSIQNQNEKMLEALEQSAQAELALEHLRQISNHDLQEPLRKIRTFTNLVHASMKNEPQAVRHLEKIDDAAAKMSMLIRNVTNYSALSKQSKPLEHIDLTNCLETAIAELQIDIGLKEAVIKYSILPWFIGAREQFVQLFKNLLENSLRFNEKKPVVIINFHEITLQRNRVRRSYLELIYSDNGIGFDQRYADKAFLIFQKVHAKKFPGNGVGLTLCKKIVENHHGTIEVSSKVNHGTIFKITLPVEYDNVAGLAK